MAVWTSNDVVNWLTCLHSGFADSYGRALLNTNIDGSDLVEIHFESLLQLSFHEFDLPIIWKNLLKLRKLNIEVNKKKY